MPEYVNNLENSSGSPATEMALSRANGPFPYQPGPTGREMNPTAGLRAESPPHETANRESSAAWAGLSALETRADEGPWALPKAGMEWAFGPADPPKIHPAGIIRFPCESGSLRPLA